MAADPRRHVLRFDRTQRTLHLCLMASFLGLAFSGMPLLFSEERWAAVLAAMLGGFRGAGFVHRVSAIVLMAVFLIHLVRVAMRLRRGERGMLWGPDSMVPQPRDFVQVVQHFRWFLHLGPKPVFDRYTYWEKFDYWAVFWGMAVIGLSGLMLWFPEAFAHVVPGWAFNVALLVHGEEALLAVGFIFTVHFFNGHLRPAKFPMDLVMFTGAVPEGELAHERPAEYARLTRSGAIDALRVPPPQPRDIRRGRLIGTVAVTAGLVMVVLIVTALLT